MEHLQFWRHPPRIQLSVVMPRASKRAVKYTDHWHSFHELAFLIEGECHWTVGGKRIRLHAGDLLLVPAGVSHYEETPGRAHARIGWIGFDLGDASADVPASLRVPLSSGDYAEELCRLFETVCTERHGDALGHAERAELALREILILLCRLSPAGTVAKARGAAKASGTPQLVNSAALTLAGNLAQPMRIRDLAHYHSLSASHFALLFRRHQGETPRKFLQNARLARSKTLLKTTALTVKEIAAACGYVDAAHFCHAFKAHTQLTPKAFRLREGD
jgi:AraC-like DNA-binding protein